MKVFIAYCSTPENADLKLQCEAFIKGVIDSENEFYLSDCEIGNREELEIVNSSDAIAFIYSVSEIVPDKLIKWMDGIWNYGFANSDINMKKLEKGIVICSTRNHTNEFDTFSLLYSIKKIMFGYKLFTRTTRTDFAYLYGSLLEKNVTDVYELGKVVFNDEKKNHSQKKAF